MLPSSSAKALVLLVFFDPHTQQKELAFAFGDPVQLGDHLEAEVSCLWKEMRKTRRWVGFGVVLKRGDREVLAGEIRTIWAK
jgi:acyl dehydratase